MILLKRNNIVGRGRLIIAQDGYVIETNEDRDNDINVFLPYSKWWKEEGVYIGMIDSDTSAWSQTSALNGELHKYVSHKQTTFDRELGRKKYIIDPKSVIEKRYKKVNMNNIKKDYDNTRTVFIWSPDIDINPEKIYQTFRDNEQATCFFDGIERFVKGKDDKNLKPILNKLNKFKEIYNNGIPEKDIQTVCDQLNITVNINDIFNNDMLNIKPKKQSRGTVKFINSYMNHLDDNKFIDNNEVILINTKKEMKKIIKEYIYNDDIYYYEGTIGDPRKIYTYDKVYKYDNKVNNIIKEFNDSIKINDFTINIKKDKELYDFIKQGVNYNAHLAFNRTKDMDMAKIENNKVFIEYDMKSAYSQYKKSSYYIGFPNLMTPEIQLENWTVEKCKTHIGYYKIYLKSINDNNKKLIMNEMGLLENKHYVLTSPEILFYNNFCSFDIISGSYSFTPYHIELTEEMKTKINDVKPYAIWAGKLNSVITHSVLRTTTTNDMCNVLSNKYDNIKLNKYIDDETKKVECVIRKEYEFVNWLGHIGGFITSYTRINVLEQLLKFKHQQIIGFKLDGFIIQKSNIDYKINENLNLDIWYPAGDKPTKAYFNWGMYIYDDYQGSIFKQEKKEYHKDIFNNRISFLVGAGGTGKSHSILEPLKDTLYLSACWSLCVDKSNEYKVNTMSIHKFVGLGCEAYMKTHKKPARIFMDEITMFDKKYIKQIINECKYSQIFIAGDIDVYGYYQCAFKDINVIKPIKNQIITFTHNYRCKDDILLKRLNDLREYMRNTNFNNDLILQYVKDIFNDRKTNEQYLIDTYDYKNDNILVSLTKTEKSQTKYYTDLLKGNKYICISHSKDDVYKRLNGKEAYLTGDIIYDMNKDIKRFIKQDAYTIHGFQGKTIYEPYRLFIDLKYIFCPRQLYTALSRVEYLDQIYLIE
jgi:hypothetical protein